MSIDCYFLSPEFLIVKFVYYELLSSSTNVPDSFRSVTILPRWGQSEALESAGRYFPQPAILIAGSVFWVRPF
jgi:hypothetical protein